MSRATARRLLRAFGSPRAVLAAPAAMRHEAAGAAAAALDRDAPGQPERLRATAAWLGATPARRIVVLGDAEYPAWLLHAADPPLLLYLDGRVDLLGAKSVAIVGSRRPTPQGLANARAFGQALSARGWAIVSGLAAGIDAAAHGGALGAEGGTIAVVGTGIDIVYPRANRELAAEIARRGLLVSEFALGAPPLALHFPQRNRIIAGLSRGTLVVEAALRSGSLITARLAAEAGREVFAIPGSIHSPQAKGCHVLIRQGAKLVETAQDIIEELEPALLLRATAAAAAAEPASETDPVLAALGHDPASLDTLIDRCGWTAARLGARLLELELAGQVARLPGGLYQRIAAT